MMSGWIENISKPKVAQSKIKTLQKINIDGNFFLEAHVINDPFITHYENFQKHINSSLRYFQ